MAGVGGIFVSLNGSTKKIGSKNRDGYELAIHALELLRDMAFDGVHSNWVMHSNNADDFANRITLCETYKVSALSVMCSNRIPRTSCPVPPPPRITRRSRAKAATCKKNRLPCKAFNHKLHGKIAFGTQECPLKQERALL